MALTVDQLKDLQDDLGVGSEEEIFTDVELNRLYTRAGENYNLTVYYGYRQLLAQANKFFNYTAGMTKVERKQMRDNIADTMQFWQDEARQAANQVKIVGMLRTPPKYKDAPADIDEDRNDGWYDSERDRAYSN